jgi:tRNA(adenine34) deaminase
MLEALREAEAAFVEQEVPVGAVAVFEDEVIARGHNQREGLQDPLLHAETQVIRDAAKHLGTWRLNAVTLYVTLEPCAMCAGAMVQARLGRCVFGASDPKAGVAGSVLPTVTILSNPSFNHRVEMTGGVLADPCAELLQRFFEKLRKGDGVTR